MDIEPIKSELVEVFGFIAFIVFLDIVNQSVDPYI